MKNSKQTEYLVKTFANHNDNICNSAKETLNYVHEKYICSHTFVEKLNLVRYLIIESVLKTKVTLVLKFSARGPRAKLLTLETLPTINKHDRSKP